MNEIDDVWSEMLASALSGAEASGRRDVADYLSLKAANDIVRKAGVKWLFDSMIELAAEANRSNPAIAMETETPHSFTYKGSNHVGALLRIRLGVRCLTIEAGWTRTPGDGFMRGGAMAVARIIHFGIKGANSDLILVRPDDTPQWFTAPDDDTRISFDSTNIREHFDIFLGI